MASGKVSVNGVEMYYEIKGSGPHSIVCIPGAMGSTEDFVKQFKHFGTRQEFTIVALDPRGFGKSRPPQRQFTNDFHTVDAKDAKGLMDALGFKQFTVFGFSDGAMVAMILASLYPDSVRKLVVWGGNAFLGEEDTKIYTTYKEITALNANTQAKLGKVYGDELAASYWRDWIQLHLKIYKNGGDICKDHLVHIKCPTLVIHGKKDPIVPLYHLDYIVKNISNCEQHIIEEGFHSVHSDDGTTDEFNCITGDFLAK